MNVGAIDRLIRAILGAGLIWVALTKSLFPALFAGPVMTWGAVAVGAILLFTAVVSFCPLYRLMGCSTRR